MPTMIRHRTHAEPAKIGIDRLLRDVEAGRFEGTYLHARGIAQKPGGWKLAAYNLEIPV